jgi:hypothetical protein
LSAAKVNLDLVQKLIPANKKDDHEAQEPNEKSDEIRFGEEGGACGARLKPHSMPIASFR